MIRSGHSLKLPRYLRVPAFAATQPHLPPLDRRQQALLKLNHPQIGPMYAYRQSDQPRIGCDLLPGATLADRLRWRRRAPYNLTETLELLLPIGAALEAAHAQGVAHGNLHPAAIVYLSSTPILTAFAGAAAPGPAIYRAPEYQPDQLSPRGDVYALALIAHELLTGYPPGIGAATTPDLPPGIDAVLARALARHPRQRYPSPLALLHALHIAHQRSRGHIRHRSPLRQRSNPLATIAALLIVLSAVMGALIGFLV